MIGRVSHQSSLNRFQHFNTTAQLKFSELNRQISSGYQFSQPSERPADAAAVTSGQRRVHRIEQFSRNIANAEQWLNTTDTALQATHNSLIRARTLVVQGLNSGTGSISAEATAAELREIAESLLGIANTRVDGRAMFAGTASGPAYGSDGAYLGDDGSVSRAIDTHEILVINHPGPAVFGAANPADPLHGSAFEMLHAIADGLEAGDQTITAGALDAIDAATARVDNAQITVGALTNRVMDAAVRIEDEAIATQSRVSKLRDTDVAEALIQLRSAESGYEALLAVTARSMGTSLLDFIR